MALQSEGVFVMLKQRIFTAIALLLVLLPAVFYSHQTPFLVVTALLVSAAAWEWARMNGLQSVGSLVYGTLTAATCALVGIGGGLHTPMALLWLVVGSTWVLGGALLLRGGVTVWQRLPVALRLLLGWVALMVAWLAVAKARSVGIHFLFSVLALVWAADVFAYAFGRTLGNRWIAAKLAPAISPGKTWEGAIGGFVGVAALASLSIWADSRSFTDSIGLYTHLLQRGWFFLLVAILFLTCMSVVGDLLESLFKRSAGVKDSSGLLPGHGGVLDRVDALLPILPLALMLLSV